MLRASRVKAGPHWLGNPESAILWTWWMGKEGKEPGRGCAMIHHSHAHSTGHRDTCHLLGVTRIGKWG